MDLETLLGVDKVYCISLEKNRNNWDSILSNIRSNGFPSCEIFEGVNGSQYKSNLSNIVGVWQQYNLENNIQRSNHEQFSTYGAIGCYMSHINIWKDIIKNGYNKVLVFEDDISFSDNFINNFKERIPFIPENYDFLFLDIIYSYSSSNINKYFKKINSLFFGTHSYIITNNAAKLLLTRAFPIEVQIDSYVSYLGNILKFNMYYTKGLCGQRIHFSSIQSSCNLCDAKKTFHYEYFYILFTITIIFGICLIIFKPGFFYLRK